MEVASMKTLLARRLALAALALALVWIFSCSEDTTCPTCPKPAVCHDPSKALLGTWVVFKSTVNGNPTQMYVGMHWDFRDNDTLIVDNNTTYNWSANDSLIYIMILSTPSMHYIFSYSLEADTLNVRSKVFVDGYYWRFRRTS
jgi:hypothetical protein